MSAIADRSLVVLSLVAAAAWSAAGCYTVRRSDPARTATEQLLIAYAVERAADGMEFPLERGTRVSVKDAFLEGYDKQHALAVLRDRIGRAGGVLVAEAKDAAVSIEVRASAMSVDRDEFLIGVPSIPIPVPLVGTLSTPELALFKRDRQTGVARLAATVFDAEGRRLAAVGPRAGASEWIRWTVLLFVSWTSRDYALETAESAP